MQKYPRKQGFYMNNSEGSKILKLKNLKKNLKTNTETENLR